jgi:hypothetical protein
MIELYKNYNLNNINRIWINIEDFPYYQISNYGELKCLRKLDLNKVENIKSIISEIINYFKY